MTSKTSLLDLIELVTLLVLSVIPKIQGQEDQPIQRFEFRSNFSSLEILFSGKPTIRYESIELTDDKNGGSRALHRYPAQLIHPVTNKSLSFNTTFVFQILGLSSNEGQVADGIVFLLGPKSIIDEDLKGGTCLGFTCDNYGSNDNYNKPQRRFGVEFDTFMNYCDPDGDHIGININSVNSTVVARLHNNSTAGHNSSISLHKNMTLQSWIEYRGGDVGNIKVWLAENGTSRPQIPHIDFNVSLHRVLNPISYPGFSATTGSQSSIQTIFSWSFSAEEVHLPPSFPPDPGVISKGRRKGPEKSLVLGIPLATVSFLVTILVLLGLKLRRRTRKNQRRNGNSAAKSILQSSTLVTYSYKELHIATSGFKELLGRGGSSSVYKAVLPKTSSIVAVKCLINNNNNNNTQFLAELEVISNIRHQNLVSLKGWCQDEDKLLLVYEYMSKGSLDKLLFDSVSPLPWSQRYDIIRSVAEGLAYLHDGLEKIILHRDVKAANVLLDANAGAKLGDFGLAKFMTHTRGRPESLTRAGTPGYMSPELVYTGRATEKSDVYSYGILVLEVVAGRPCVDCSTILSRTEPERLRLLDWTWKLYKSGKLMKVVDPKIAAECDAREVLVALQLGLLCCSIDPSKRPTMRKCCQILGGDSEVPSLRGLKPAVMDDIFAVYGNNGVSRAWFGSSNEGSSYPLIGSSSKPSSVPLIDLSSGTGGNNTASPPQINLLATGGNQDSVPLIDFSSKGSSNASLPLIDLSSSSNVLQRPEP